MICKKCGSQIEDGFKFCPNCGNPMEQFAAAAGAEVNASAETTAAETSSVVSDDANVSAETAGTVAEESAETETYTTFNEVSGETAGEAEFVQQPESVSGTSSDTSTENVVAGAFGGTSQVQEDAAENHNVNVAQQAQENVNQTQGIFNASYNQGGFVQGSFNGTPNQGSFNANSNQGGIDGAPNRGSFNANPNQAGFNGVPNQGGYNANPNQGGFNGAPNMNAPAPKSGISTIGQVFTIVALVLMFFQCFRVIGSFFGILGYLADEGVIGLLYGAMNFLINVIKLGGLALSAVTTYLIWKKWDDSKAEPLMAGVLTGGVLILATVVLRAIFTSLINFAVGYDIGSLFSGAFLSVIFSAAMMALVYMKITEKQIDPMAGLKSNFGNGIKEDLKTVGEMAVQAKNEFQAGKNTAQYTGANAPTGNSVNQQYTGANGNINPNGQPYGGPAGPLSTDRSIVAYILLGLITCGIYDLYMIHLMIQDVNVTCAGDGKVTKGILEYILFGILTCGIYDYVWLYNFANRIQSNAPRYGMRFEEGGTTILLWWILGAWLCGVGPFYAMYLIIKNTNALNAAYNNMIAQQQSNQ
ncbi:MAG: DUF4234 domain-containing protein [Oribacterium sp.]|nr:DUF4234 domain-containing protein [Oribacterium sp.]